MFILDVYKSSKKTGRLVNQLSRDEHMIYDRAWGAFSLDFESGA